MLNDMSSHIFDIFFHTIEVIYCDADSSLTLSLNFRLLRRAPQRSRTLVFGLGTTHDLVPITCTGNTGVSVCLRPSLPATVTWEQDIAQELMPFRYALSFPFNSGGSGFSVLRSVFCFFRSSDVKL